MNREKKMQEILKLKVYENKQTVSEPPIPHVDSVTAKKCLVNFDKEEAKKEAELLDR